MIIEEVSAEGIGAELGLLAGDELIRFDGFKVRDLLDYLYYDIQEAFTMAVMRGGELLEFEIEKDGDETLGLTFSDNGLTAMSCRNRCIFCFVDQLPRGLRPSLYVRDDDYRHSLIYGNYVTLTNLKSEDVERILRYRLSPLYISVHTTDPELRRRMLRSRRAGELMELLGQFAAHGIRMHTQIVLCAGWNDGEELLRTLRDLAKLSPAVRSAAVVPVGLTAHRENLTPLAPVTPAIAARTLDDVAAFRAKLREEGNDLEVWCSDECYVRAGREIPPADFYADFAQIEDGVGIMAKFGQDLEAELEELDGAEKFLPSDLVSGVSAYGFLSKITDELNGRFPGTAHLHLVENHFFGETITVSGLMTGRDLAEQLLGRLRTGRLILPRVMLRESTDVFLDDMTVGELAKRLGVEVVVSEPGHFLEAFRARNGGKANHG